MSDKYRNESDRKRFKESRDRQSSHLSLSFNRQVFDKNFPTFQKPKILGDFSVDGSRHYCDDRSQLKFFNEKRFKNVESGNFEKVDWDMNAGMSKVIHKCPECKDEKIDHMLRYSVKTFHS